MSNEGTLYERIWLRCYFAKIPLWGTSDTPGTLSEIAGGELGKD